MVKTQLICKPLHKRLLTKHDLRRFAVKCSKKYRLLLLSYARTYCGMQSKFRQLITVNCCYTSKQERHMYNCHRAVSFSFHDQCAG